MIAFSESDTTFGVTGVPSAHLASLRSVNVIDRSSRTHFVARYGTGLYPGPRPSSRSYAKTMWIMLLEIVFAGKSKSTQSAGDRITTVPPASPAAFAPRAPTVAASTAPATTAAAARRLRLHN